MSAGRVVLVIFGSLVSMAALGLLVGGAFLLWANGAKTDDAGFFITDTGNLAGGSYALVARDLKVVAAARAVFTTDNFATLKVSAKGSTLGKDTFIGIARQSALDEYLGNVEYDEVTRVDLFPFRAEFRPHSGAAVPAPPASQSFWDASAQGTGAQPLLWKVKSGTWSVVVMNADASRGIDVDVSAGVKVPFVFRLGIGLLIGGLVAGAIGGLMVYLGVRGTRKKARQAL